MHRPQPPRAFWWYQPANIQVVGTVLGKLGHEIIPAADGPTALKRFELRPPDLILLDLMMPHMDGIEVCRRLMGKTSGLAEAAEILDIDQATLSQKRKKSVSNRGRARLGNGEKFPDGPARWV